MARSFTRDRRGFTLVEVIVALGLLLFAVLAMASTSARFMGTIARDNSSIRGVELADNRIAQVRLDPAYDSLAARYQGTELDPSGYTGFTRTTKLVSQGGGATPAYTTVTVTVTGPGMEGAVSRTTTVGAP